MGTEIIIALIALVVSGFSLYLTFYSFRQQKRQNDNFVRELRVNANRDIIDSHRDLFFEILKDEYFVSKVAPNSNEIEQFKTEMLGTILINHCEHIYKTAKNNLFSNDDWIGIQNDIEDFFNWSIVKTRWQSNRKFYSEDFQTFIDNIAVKGRQTKLMDVRL
ncbi:MAG: hypothetical protein LBP63_02310 [Prevotellaceae bacterium]|jgi:hypothetical protein|nr:hypothetical protein [Prevotellaceae bacterium]